VVLVVYPAGSDYQTSAPLPCRILSNVLTRKLLLKVLVVLVAVLVEANEGTSLGVTCALSVLRPLYHVSFSKRTNVLYVRASSISRVYRR
jgi:hypothetical protein